MSHRVYLRTILKNVNEKNVGCVNIEIAFTHKVNKKKTRRYVNTNQYINTTDFGKRGIKTNRADLISLKHLIDKKKQEISEFLRNLEMKNGKISPEIYDDEIRVSEDAKKDILQLFEIFLKFKKKTKTYRTYQKFKSIKNALVEFIDKEHIKNLYPADITKKFLTDFTVFLTETRGLGIDTLNKYQSGFNTFMDYVTIDLGIDSNLAYRDFEKVSRNRESDTKVVLLKEHVRKINKYRPTNERYQKVKDLFLFQILTGIRYSDLIRVKKSFVQNEQLSFIMYKTNKRVNIPLHRKAKSILLKYNYNIGEHAKSLKNYNIDLKTLCRKAGLTDEVSTLKLKLTEKISDDTPLCELISSHVGRTTFITNCLISGISPYIVMSYSGHKKIETLTYYMKLAGNTSQDAFIKFQDYFNFR